MDPFCKNEESKWSTVNWIENQGENLYKMLKNLNWVKITQTLDPSISVTIYDSDKPIFDAERGEYIDMYWCSWALKRVPSGIENLKNWTSLPCPRMVVHLRV